MKQLTDRRQALPKYTVLSFGADGDRGYIYTVTGESGRGASCIVYQGYYENSLGEKKTVYIKECYPFSLKMSRSADYTLFCEDEAAFASYKKRFSNSFSLCNRIFETDGLTNSTSNYMDIHEKNGTLYTVMTYRQGQELSLTAARSLKETIRIVKSVAKTIAKIHENGYLYLDTKPENILVLDEMNESIQLFDFDSMIPTGAGGEMKDHRISYTKGFAPLEQRKGRLDQICEATDVYGVGALLFYMVFGRTPGAKNCDPFAVYSYDDARYEAWRYRDRLFSQMSEFFKKALAVSIGDRYETMDMVVDQLALLERDADLAAVFIRDSYYPVRIGMVGRETEMERVCDLIGSDGGCLFVVGMGGIGKSTLIRSCLDRKRSDIDTVLYLYFHDSLIDTIADDRQLMINTLGRMREETTEEYFHRKLETIRRIAEDQKVILVIDNFEGELGEEFAAIREVGWQVIVISRTDPEVDDDPVLYVEAVEESQRKELFERYLGRALEDREIPDFDKLMDHIQGHTLATEVIAKQIKRSLLTIEQASEITKSSGFSKISDDGIAFSRDGVHAHSVVVRILSDIFAADKLCEVSRAILQNLSFFEMPGIQKSEFIRLSQVPALEAVTEMILSGWVTDDAGVLSIHPVIKEAIKPWSWHEYSISTAMCMMKGLINGDKPLVMSVLKNAKSFDPPRQTEEYYALLSDWIATDPRDEEELLLSVKDLIGEATEYADPVKLVEGVDFLNYVLCEAGLYDDASSVLAVMDDFVGEREDPFLSGLLESTLSQYYDCVLDGVYETNIGAAEELFDARIKATEDSIADMCAALDIYKDTDKEKWLLAKYYKLRYILDYQVIFVRYFNEDQLDPIEMYEELYDIREIVDAFIEENEDKFPVGRMDELKIHMELTWGWLHTMVIPDEDETAEAIHRIWAVRSPWKTPLDDIDFRYVPCAEMLFRHGNKKESENILLRAVSLCEEHEDVLPYQRKRAELMEHIEDVRHMM